MNKNIWTFLLIVVLTNPVFCQDQSDSTYRSKPKITPFLVPSYSPEVELMIVAGGIFTFQTGPDIDTKRSSLPFNVGWSTNNSKEIEFRPVIYSRGNNMRFFGRLSLKEMPDHYYGVGYDNGRYTETSDSTTQYQRLWWQTDISILRRIKNDLFGGIRFDINRTKATDLNPEMMQDPWIIDNGPDIQNSGVGIILQYDSRDFEVNANSGLLLNFNATFYGSIINSDFAYRMYIFDYRQFKSIQPGKVLAWEFRVDQGSGDIPWTDLAKLGNAFSLRGYRFGRYRDKTAGFGLVEYRHTFRRMRSEDKHLSKHRIVFWAGAGSMGPRINKWNGFLPNYGIGYRFEAQPKINARLDFGFGVESSGFYINFNEAF